MQLLNKIQTRYDQNQRSYIKVMHDIHKVYFFLCHMGGGRKRSYECKLNPEWLDILYNDIL